MVDYKFECEEETLREINAIEAQLGMSHREFVTQAAAYIEDRQEDFEDFTDGDDKRRRRR